MAYDFTALRVYCEHHKLMFSEQLARDFVPVAETQGLTQDQFDALTRHHAWVVKQLFTPRNYSVWNRVKIAAHFLFGGR